jgi:hypothetical protein
VANKPLSWILHAAKCARQRYGLRFKHLKFRTAFRCVQRVTSVPFRAVARVCYLGRCLPWRESWARHRLLRRAFHSRLSGLPVVSCFKFKLPCHLERELICSPIPRAAAYSRYSPTKSIKLRLSCIRLRLGCCAGHPAADSYKTALFTDALLSVACMSGHSRSDRTPASEPGLESTRCIPALMRRTRRSRTLCRLTIFSSEARRGMASSRASSFVRMRGTPRKGLMWPALSKSSFSRCCFAHLSPHAQGNTST